MRSPARASPRSRSASTSSTASRTTSARGCGSPTAGSAPSRNAATLPRVVGSAVRSPRPASGRRLELVEILLLAACLRAGITAVGPLVDDIRASLDLSSAAAGLLTTLPLIAFGTVSPAAVAAARRVGETRVLVGAAVTVTAGGVLGPGGGAPAPRARAPAPPGA